MDTYGLALLGDITVENDNTYYLGGASNRMANIYSVYFTGIATSSEYADLAEKYSCNENLPVGTVVSVSKDPEYEISKCEVDCDPAYVGVISEDPGFLMGDREGGTIAALVGKLPVKIKGPINKSDFIVPTVGGCARAGKPGEEQFKIGIALNTSSNNESKSLLCIIR